ncbi:40.5 kDa [Spodoptera frugiperda ascovirus 1a]|uniref:40.5 kDa n=1 Tax=Spodoptera frugiperda ascovirus 1a TaxID=113370 RepID=Q0E573_SFAVA|nr:40.5 kDa [Spodoptera frugiperda ascovirus 1a]CAL44628.1 40.5 kDa [Spodoptera frugiperda ascovirus 1a]
MSSTGKTTEPSSSKLENCKDMAVSESEYTNVEDYIDEDTLARVQTLVKFTALVHFLRKLSRYFPDVRGLRDTCSTINSYKYSDTSVQQEVCNWLLKDCTSAECRLSYVGGKVFFDLRTELRKLDDDSIRSEVQKRIVDAQQSLADIDANVNNCMEYMTLRKICNKLLLESKRLMGDRLSYDATLKTLTENLSVCTSVPKCARKLKMLVERDRRSIGDNEYGVPLNVVNISRANPCNVCRMAVFKTLDVTSITSCDEIKRLVNDAALDRDLLARIFFMVVLNACRLDENLPELAKFIRDAYDNERIFESMASSKDILHVVMSVVNSDKLNALNGGASRYRHTFPHQNRRRWFLGR